MMDEYVLRDERKDNSDGKNNVWIIALDQFCFLFDLTLYFVCLI